MIEANVIEAAHRADVAKLLFLGSSCIYPKLAPQPISEDALLTGPARTDERMVCHRQDRRHQALPGLSASNMAAISSRLCRRNLYGPFDNFDLETSHVLPALMRKFHEAKLARSTTKS